MSSSDERKGFDWSLIIAAAVGGGIALVAAFASGYWKAHTDAQATKSAQSRLVRGSVRAWRDDLYDAEALIGYAIEKRRWTAERDPPARRHRGLQGGQPRRVVGDLALPLNRPRRPQPPVPDLEATPPPQ